MVFSPLTLFSDTAYQRRICITLAFFPLNCVISCSSPEWCDTVDWVTGKPFTIQPEKPVLIYSRYSFFRSTHTHPFNGPFSGTTQVSRYQKGKTNLDFTEARDSEWQRHQLGHMQVCISLQTDSHANTPPLLSFYRPDALPAAQPTASKH